MISNLISCENVDTEKIKMVYSEWNALNIIEL
jgi:hypothetical protein